jgi:hypothetical protein
MTLLSASSEKGKRFNTEHTEEIRRTQRKIKAYCEFKSDVKYARLKKQVAATLRSGTAGSQAASRCRAIHKFKGNRKFNGNCAQLKLAATRAKSTSKAKSKTSIGRLAFPGGRRAAGRLRPA